MEWVWIVPGVELHNVVRFGRYLSGKVVRNMSKNPPILPLLIDKA